MSLKQFMLPAAFIACNLLFAPLVLGQITITTVPIGNPGNAPDPTTGYGSVAYTYNIGATEVTNAQYAAFLNAVAATDTNSLYSTGMSGALGGIIRSGSSGSYTYATVIGRENHPVNYVSFWDATRFANWLHNGQPAGAQNNSTTEDGTYTLTPDGISANTVARNPSWQWAVTSENEWYKAAYHQPASAGGDSDNYWLYPTSSNSITTNQANYADVITITTPVGSYAANFYGTFDMGGNVFEWTEAIISVTKRVLRGGSFTSSDINLRATDPFSNTPTIESVTRGFRVSQAAPPAPCVGDLNGDNAVNTQDLTAFLARFGTTVTPGGPGDFNNDGAVNTADLTTFLGRFGSAC
jgi:formylglycine-generating enzyme required for sulfatase activity